MSNPFSWLRNLWNRKSARPRPPARRSLARFRPFVEVLEDRWVPTVGFASAFTLGVSSLDAVAVDAAGATYLAGAFSRTRDFDPGPAEANLTSAGFSDVFVAKYNADGSLAWARGLGGPNTEWARALTLDAAGNVYVTGEFRDTALFGSISLTAQGEADVFAAKLDASGNVVWAARLGGDYGRDYAADIAVDVAGNVFVTGEVQATAAYYFPDGDIFVTKLDAAGHTVWSHQFGAPSKDGSHGSSEYGAGIAIDSLGNVVVTGTFMGTVDFDPGPKSFNLSSGGGKNSPSSAAFVLKLNNAGGFIWAGAFAGGDGAMAEDLAVDASNNIYVAGAFFGNVDFDPGKGRLTLPYAGGGTDAFLVKLNSAGNLLWGRSMGGAVGGSNGDRAYAIALDATGSVYVTGSFQGTMTVGSTTLTSAGGEDIFVAKFSSSGQSLWTVSMGGPSLDRGYDIAVDAAGNVYIAGICAHSSSGSAPWADLDPSEDEYIIEGPSRFLVKLHQV